MVHTLRAMVRTRKESIPHREILEVTAIIHAGAQSLREKGRLVERNEVSAIVTVRFPLGLLPYNHSPEQHADKQQ